MGFAHPSAISPTIAIAPLLSIHLLLCIYFLICSINKGNVFFDDIILHIKLIMLSPVLNKLVVYSWVLSSSFSIEFIRFILTCTNFLNNSESFFVKIFFDA
jgi:hypothetical protein